MFLLIMSLCLKVFIFIHLRGYYDLQMTSASGARDIFHYFSHHFLYLNGSLNTLICYIDHYSIKISKKTPNLIKIV